VSNADPYDLSERLYQAADAIRDGSPIPPDLAAFLGGLQAGGQLQPDGSPFAASFVQPEVTPPAAPRPAGSFQELLGRIPDVERALASGDEQAGQDAAWQLAEQYNALASQHAAERSREQFPQAARSDEELARLHNRAYTALMDPAGVDPVEVDRIVGSVNETIGQLAAEREEHADAIERQREAAAAARAAQQRQEAPLIKRLEELLAQARAGQQPAGR
jgi:hypothetical protein